MSEYVMVKRDVLKGALVATENRALFPDIGSQIRVALSAPAPQGIGREDLNDFLSDWFENKVYGFRDTGNETIRAHGDFGQEFSHFALADAILALLPTEPPAQGEG